MFVRRILVDVSNIVEQISDISIYKLMQQTATNPSTRWFVRVDQDKSPAYLTLYTFVGAKFEAHRILIEQESVCDWIEKIYPYPDIREVFEEILFSPEYPEDVFSKILPRLCKIRDLLGA